MSIVRLNLIVIGAVVAVTSSFACGLLIPGMGALAQARADLSRKIATVRADQEKVGSVSDLYASIMDMDEQMWDFRKRLPAERQFGEFLNELSENLRKSGIDDYLVQPRPGRPLDGTKLPASMKLAKGTIILPVSVSFRGSFEALFDFLKKMESLSRLSHVANLKMVNDENGPGRVGVEVVFHTYHQPEKLSW